ncbi:MAG TPA: rhodanese-like domain-containing protein [Thermoanaerobaculia bacterium]|jgi:rhodanese-related sulfurtransferase
MRKTLAAAFVLTLTAGIASAQYKKPTTPVRPNAPGSPVKMTPGATKEAIQGVRKISIDQAIEFVEDGKAVFVDVRSKEQYDLGHIKGALSIPGSQLISRLKEVPPGKMIIAYCACSAEQSSGKAVVDLNAHGYKNAAALTGGWNEWKKMKLPMAP